MSDQAEQELLATLAERAGIATEYHDIHGKRHLTSDETRRAILRAMGFLVDSTETLAASVRSLEEAPWRRVCDPVRIVYEGEDATPFSCYLQVEDGKDHSVILHMQVQDDTGETVQEEQAGPGLRAVESKLLEGRRHVRIEIPGPKPLPPGYYDLTVRTENLAGGPVGTTRLIVAPRRCYIPPELESGRRLWGWAIQLYALSSSRNWGCGDFTDLRELVERMGNQSGVGIIGLNPLHAIRNSTPYHSSPYAPLNRLALNELYIDVERLSEFYASGEAQKLYNTSDFQAQLKALRESRQVDYEAVAAAKRTMLDWAYRQFLRDAYTGEEPNLEPKTARAKLFDRFIRTEGEPLELYATFLCLEEERRLIQSKTTMWQEWPTHFLAPSPAVREYAKRHRKRIRFFQYIQWIAAEQLAEVQRTAEQAGMPIGLYNDVALGAERNGAEAWMYQSVLALDADCGAPPDDFSTEGQNWGLPPVNPIALRENRYELLIQLLRRNLRFGGAIRLDHVMAMFRLFWIPKGLAPSHGTYVHYPFEEWLAIVALESMRAKTLVIGEDLGTVPDWVREHLAKVRVLSYRVLYFERRTKGEWKAPNEYPEQALAVVSTHDLPTLAGFWSGEDIRVRSGLGFFQDEAARRQASDERERDKARMLAALKAEGLLPSGMVDDPAKVPSMTPELCQAVHTFLARTPSWVVLANLEDGLLEVSQTNMPGTVEAYSNWTRKYGVRIDELVEDQRLRALGACLRSARPIS